MKQPILSPAAELREKIRWIIGSAEIEHMHTVDLADVILDLIKSRDEELIESMTKMKKKLKDGEDNLSHALKVQYNEPIDDVIALIRKRQ